MSPSSEELIFVYEEEAILVKRAYATYYREMGHLEKALNYYDELSDAATQTGDRYHYKLALNEKIEIYRAQGRDDLIADEYKVLYENEQDIKKTLQLEYRDFVINYVPSPEVKLVSHQFRHLALGLASALIILILVFQRQFKHVKQELHEDLLCRVYNRRYMQRYFKQIKATQLPLSVMMIDIDYFKKYNDYYGHLAGDEALCQVANLLKTTFRQTDVVVRYGGEEFCVILPHTTEEESKICAKKLIERMNKFQLKHPNSPIKPHMTLSIGIQTVYKTSGLATAIHLADQALYQTKKEGRNHFTHYADYTHE